MHYGVMNAFLFQRVLFSFTFFQTKIKLAVTLTFNPVQDGSFFLIILTFNESLKVILINVTAILMLSAKTATPDLFKIKVIQNKSYGVIIFVYDFPQHKFFT